MTRLEALQLAREQVAELCKPPIKSNGYIADNWRQPTAAEMVAMTLKVATFLLADEEIDRDD